MICLPEWVPGMKWTWAMIKKGKKLTSEVQYSPFHDVKKRMVRVDFDLSGPSFEL